MTPRNFGQQGKRDDQVSFSWIVAGTCFGILAIILIGRLLLSWTAP